MSNLKRPTPKQRPSGSGNTRRPRNPRTSVVTKQQLRGGRIHVPSNPPDISYQPWFSLTVVKTSNGANTAVTLGDLVNSIVDQIDPMHHAFKYRQGGTTPGSDVPVLNIKINTVRAWNLSGHMIAMSVDDYSDSRKDDSDMLCGLVDVGSPTHVPAIGYDLPSSVRDFVLRNGNNAQDDIKVKLYHIIAPKSDTIVVYTSILFKFDGPIVFSTFANTMMSISSKLSQDLDDTRNHIKKLTDRDTSMGIGSVVIKGVEMAAPYVIASAAADMDSEVREQLDKIIEKVDNLNISKSPSEFSYCESSSSKEFLEH